MIRATPVLLVDSIPPVLPFWRDRLGFAIEHEVEHEGEPGFVSLKLGDAVVMYQTRASMAADVPPLADLPASGTLLFIRVDDLDAVQAALADIDMVVPRRQTSYGSEELIVREPAGNAIIFAQFSS